MPRNLGGDERQEIITLHREGLNISQIAEELNMARATVRRWIKRFEAEGSLEDKERSRPLRVVKQLQIDQMVKTYFQNPTTPTKKFAEEFKCSRDTIRRHLHRNDMYIRQKKRVPEYRYIPKTLAALCDIAIKRHNEKVALERKQKEEASRTTLKLVKKKRRRRYANTRVYKKEPKKKYTKRKFKDTEIEASVDPLAGTEEMNSISDSPEPVIPPKKMKTDNVPFKSLEEDSEEVEVKVKYEHFPELQDPLQQTIKDEKEDERADDNTNAIIERIPNVVVKQETLNQEVVKPISTSNMKVPSVPTVPCPTVILPGLEQSSNSKLNSIKEEIPNIVVRQGTVNQEVVKPISPVVLPVFDQSSNSNLNSIKEKMPSIVVRQDILNQEVVNPIPSSNVLVPPFPTVPYPAVALPAFDQTSYSNLNSIKEKMPSIVVRQDILNQEVVNPIPSSNVLVPPFPTVPYPAGALPVFDQTSNSNLNSIKEQIPNIVVRQETLNQEVVNPILTSNGIVPPFPTAPGPTVALPILDQSSSSNPNSFLLVKVVVDKMQAFANEMAEKLRQMPEHKAVQLQYHIRKIIEYELSLSR